MSTEFKLPGLGENIESGDVVTVLVEPGQVIEPNQNVLELETDKAVIEVPCPYGGRIAKVHVKPGDKIPVGETVLTLDEDQSGAPEPSKKKKAQEEKDQASKKKSTEKAKTPEEEPDKQPVEQKPEQKPEKKPEAILSSETPQPRIQSEDNRPPAPAGPATRRFARQLGVDLHQVNGTGPGGRISREDVEQFVKTAMQGGRAAAAGVAGSPPLPDFSRWGEIERQPLSGIRRKTAEAMSLAWRTVPHVTQFDVADITELEATRKKSVEARRDQLGKITMTALAIKASIAALRQYPQFNSSLDESDGTLIFKKYYHIGVAVDTEHGLLVPTLRNADQKTLLELAVELEQLAEKARGRKLTPEQMQGGTFTLSNLGGIGGTAFTPIVYHPQVAILGMARARKEMVVMENEPAVRLMLPLSLSYDHRVIDGADGARFLRKICLMLSNPMQLLLEA